MARFSDQLGDIIELKGVPQRIISLVPSQTQLLYELGLSDEVVGITKFCIHPDSWFRSKERIGGTKKVNIEKVKALQPDLIIGNKEENEQHDIETLREIAPVWMSDIYNLEDALDMIRSVGKLTERTDKAEKIVSNIGKGFTELSELVNARNEQPKVLYCIWNDPVMVAGKNTFINDMLTRCGFKNVIQEDRYPEIDLSGIHPDLILLSSEPYPFKEKHINFFEQKFPGAKVLLVDGEAFSWYGSKLLESPVYFKSIIS